MPTETAELEIVAPEARLTKYANEAGLEQSATTPLVSAFAPIFKEARTVLGAARGVAETVKDATCVTEIRKARECRLAIRKVRIAGEKVRKDQKATVLAYGKAVDGFYNILEADLAPVEKELQDAEDTAERAEVARKDVIEAGRKAALAPFVTDVALYAVRDMAEPAFAALLTGVRVAKEQAEAAAVKAKADRIAAEEARLAEEARIKAENERLRLEAEALAEANRQNRLKEQAAREVVRQKAESDAKAAAEVARKEREAIEAKAKADAEAQEARNRSERAAADIKAKAEKDAALAIAAKERVARQKAEAQLKAAQEAVAAKIHAEALAAKKAANAGDAEKINNYAATLRHTTPSLKNKQVQEDIEKQALNFIAWLEKKVEAL